MTFSLTGFPTPLVFSKNTIAVQNFLGLTVKLNVAGCTFSPGLGVGQASATSTAILVNAGGWENQRVVGTLQYPSPTASGSQDLGVMLRAMAWDTPPGITGYWCRSVAGMLRWSKVVNGVASTLTQKAWAPLQGQLFTMDASAVTQPNGDVRLDCSVTGGPGPDSLGWVDTAASSPIVGTGGLMGVRSLVQAMWLSDINVYQL